MKRHWRLGILLGVSLALLLAGGVALAQALTMTVDQDCFECWPGTAAPDDEHVVVVTADDYPAFPICSEFEIDGELYFPAGECQMPPQPPCEALLAVACQDLELWMQNDCTGQSGFVGSVEYGDWVIRAWQIYQGQPWGPVREVAFRFAEDCEAVEFVPEPGTIALLGSGLAGLAGYAALRWRARS